MFDTIHRHSKRVFETDLGVILGVTTCVLWFAHQIFARQPIDFTSVITLTGFLTVFVIERAHSREMKAVHLKLDELLAAQVGASNRLIKAEDAPESLVLSAHKALHSLANEKESHESVSIDHTDFFLENEKIA